MSLDIIELWGLEAVPGLSKTFSTTLYLNAGGGFLSLAAREPLGWYSAQGGHWMTTLPASSRGLEINVTAAAPITFTSWHDEEAPIDRQIVSDSASLDAASGADVGRRRRTHASYLLRVEWCAGSHQSIMSVPIALQLSLVVSLKLRKGVTWLMVVTCRPPVTPRAAVTVGPTQAQMHAVR